MHRPSGMKNVPSTLWQRFGSMLPTDTACNDTAKIERAEWSCAWLGAFGPPGYFGSESTLRNQTLQPAIPCGMPRAAKLLTHLWCAGKYSRDAFGIDVLKAKNVNGSVPEFPH